MSKLVNRPRGKRLPRRCTCEHQGKVTVAGKTHLLVDVFACGEAHGYAQGFEDGRELTERERAEMAAFYTQGDTKTCP